MSNYFIRVFYLVFMKLPVIKYIRLAFDWFILKPFTCDALSSQIY